ncbi:MAG TPA: hypothetical protein VLE02_01790 [Nitrosarchaeum sp.]|nr:hypothetical protein [Nitrosarchaeum sp.]
MVIVSSYKIIDLRSEALTQKCEIYLAYLIAETCEQDLLKLKMSLIAKNDFEWDNGNLINYVIAYAMTSFSMRMTRHISSGDWLCGVLTSGKELKVDHVKIMMAFVNKNVLWKTLFKKPYVSGKDAWKDAPEPLKNILDILDSAAVNEESVEVVVPRIVPNTGISIKKLEKMTHDVMRKNCTIIWE